MTNFVFLIMLIITFIPIVLGFLLGFSRGLKKSILRLILIVICIIFSFLFAGTITDFILTLQINGNSIEELIKNAIPEQYKEYSHLIMPIAETLLIAVGFMLLFLILQLSSMIIYVIFSIFFKKEKDGIRKKQYRLFGCLVGLVQGLVIAFILGAPLTGISKEAVRITDLELNNNKIIDLSTKKILGLNIDFNEYNESAIATIYDKLGNGVFVSLTTTTNSDGKKVTLSGQIDAFVGAVEMANQITKIPNIDFSSGINATNVNEIKNVLVDLDSIKSEMSEESLETLNDIVTTIAGDFLPELDLSNVDIAEVNFTQEGKIIEDLLKYQDSTEAINVDELINSVAKSDLIIPIASASDITVELDETQKEAINQSISKLEDVDKEKIEDLKAIFGITE